jgi:hypothetical protein
MHFSPGTGLQEKREIRSLRDEAEIKVPRCVEFFIRGF